MLYIKNADFLKQLMLRVQSLITDRYIKSLKYRISGNNHQLSIDVLIM